MDPHDPTREALCMALAMGKTRHHILAGVLINRLVFEDSELQAGGFDEVSSRVFDLLNHPSNAKAAHEWARDLIEKCRDRTPSSVSYDLLLDDMGAE